MANIISLTGDLGSGKSTVSNLLCERLNYDYIYTGKIQREIADRYKMTTLELNKYSETHPEIDEEIDATFKSLNNSENLIVDSRLAWFFIPSSFKVFLKINLVVSSERIYNETERISESYASKEEAAYNIIARKASENKRYGELYGADCSNLNNFDLVVDTSFIGPERVADIIIQEFEFWKISQKDTIIFISPKNLYPTQPVKAFDNNCFHSILNKIKNNGYNLDFPITAVNIDSFDYILDGHKRTSCALKNNIDLIPVVYKNENSTLVNPVNLNLFHDWEKFNSFKYLLYPRLLM